MSEGSGFVHETLVRPGRRVRKKYRLRRLVARMPTDYAPAEEGWGKRVGKEAWYVPSECALTGFVMVDQVDSVDFQARRARLIEQAPASLLAEVLAVLDAMFY